MEKGRKEERENAVNRSVKPWSPSSLSSFLPFYPLLLCSLLLFSFKPNHDYHVSVTQMQYNSSSRSFEVSIRIFTDDLEKALSQSHSKERFVVKDNDQNDRFVEDYIRKSFVLTDSQKKNAIIKYIGKEQEADATWIYLEIPFQGALNGCRLLNVTLMEVFDDQVNMTNVKFQSEKKTFLFKKSQTFHSL
ncbi:hypothetical protein LZD49_17845 [Dyadobacter sp. CY261]|uniref:DUF6702 family protein n=1 Tax=Dyadobacter sp. CY261 TaxID=2907203 RepID=UPI001F48AC3A|nr:DUF6702 family protein [Dyadobacter sp. CY261]MCF0072349.1 hypothetical protein [Dyadobacter sp. CY261]